MPVFLTDGVIIDLVRRWDSLNLILLNDGSLYFPGINRNKPRKQRKEMKNVKEIQ